MEGIVVIDKPSGITSHDVVSKVRQRFHMQRVGHAGTLDPLATGVLVMLLGRSTKLFKEFENFDKAYKATLILGTKTTTADTEGKVIANAPYDHFTREQVEDVFKEFIGEIKQTPHMVSAVKVNGKRLYQLARKGIELDLVPRKIKINKLKLLEFHLPEVKFYLECSKGTYVRKLAEDIAEKLGCVACISEIQRTKVGPFVLEKAVALEHLTESHVEMWRG